MARATAFYSYKHVKMMIPLLPLGSNCFIFFSVKACIQKILIDDNEDVTLYRPDLDKYNFNTTPDSLCYLVSRDLRDLLFCSAVKVKVMHSCNRRKL